MRRASSVFITLAVIICALWSTTSVEAATLAGKPCSKLRATTGDGPGRTVVCVKATTGKYKGQRVWQLKKKPSTPGPTSTTSPTPTATPSPTASCSRPTFTHDLISLASVQVVVPIGQQTAFGGVLSVRSYVHTKPELNGQQLPVMAPTDMTLTSAAYYRAADAPTDQPGEYSLFFDAGCGVEVQLYHIKGVVGSVAAVVPKDPVPSSAGQQVARTKIRAGEQIGWYKGGGNSVAFDFRVQDNATTNRFINQQRFANSPFASGELHAICPYSLYTGAQRDRWLAQLGAPSSNPVPGTQCGEISQGTTGTAQGMWFFADARVNELTYRGLTWDQGLPAGQYQSQILFITDALGSVRVGGLNATRPMVQLILGKENPTWRDPLSIVGGQEHCWSEVGRSVKVRLSSDGNTLTAVVGSGSCESLNLAEGITYVR